MENITQGQWFRGPSADLGDEISQSLRFRGSTLSKSLTNHGSFTASMWIKRGKFETEQTFFEFSPADADLRFLSNDTLKYYDNATAGTSNAVYRDPNAWYHIVLAYDVDGNGGLGSDTVRIYINGVNSGITTSAGGNSGGGSTVLGSSAFQGMIAEFNYVTSTQLPTAFGRFNADNVWVPKTFTGTYGSQGVHLTFDSTQSNGIGHDSSGNNNHFTASGFETTALSSSNHDNDIDYSDTPTSNYAVFNALNHPEFGSNHDSGVARVNLSKVNRKAAGVTANYPNIAVSSMPGEKVYFEVHSDGSDSHRPSICIHDVNPTRNSRSSSNLIEIYRTGGAIIHGGSNLANGTFPTFTGGDCVRIKYDNSTHLFGLAVDNGSWTELDLDTLTSNGYVIPDQFVFGVSVNANNGDAFVNYGQQPFQHTPPTGYVGIQTNELPEPVIKNPKEHFDIHTYTSASTAANITFTGWEFQPDLVWIKSTSNGSSHNLYDSVRGATKSLKSNNDAVEGTTAGSLTSFDSNGFSLGTADSDINYNSRSYVAWGWKAGGTAVSNSDGSITSSVSANTDAGFSIVSYTGTGANATVGHGLNSAPEFMIVKTRDTAANWIVYHTELDNTAPEDKILVLNSTGTVTDNNEMWNDTAPTSSVFSVGIANHTNKSGDNLIAYCWHSVPGYSQFGKYTGNGSTDGMFIYTGFSPAYVMYRRTDVGNSWHIIDNKRDTYNVAKTTLYADDPSNQDSSYNRFDFCSNGFKMRSGYAANNTGGGMYIYMAFAEHPFGGKNQPPAPAR